MSILASQQAQAWGSIIMWVVIMVVFVYFFMIRPQKKEAKKNHNEIDLIHSNFLIQFSN